MTVNNITANVADTDKKENLPNEDGNATMGAGDTVQQQAAGEKTPEDTAGGYQKVIDKQNETINTLLDQIDNLNTQIARFVRKTSTPTSDEGKADPASIPEPVKPTDEEGYVYLKDLGREIGKR